MTTEAQVKTMGQDATWLLEQLRVLADGTLVADIQTAQDNLKGDIGIPRGSTAVSAFRAALQAGVTRDMARALLDPVFHEGAVVAGSPAAGVDPLRARSDWREFMRTNSRTVKSRNISFASGSAGGSNVGNGSISRLTTDEYGYKTEGVRVETKTLKCRQDQNTGARKHAEVFELYGGKPSIDWLDRVNHGSGIRQTIYSHHAGSGEGGSLLRNSSFSDYTTGGTVTTLFPGWTLDDATKFSQSGTYYRGFPGSAENTTGGLADKSISFDGNGTCSQKLRDAGHTLIPNTPYFLRVMLNRQSSCDGTFTLRFGGQNVTLDVTTLSNGTWTELLITIGTKNWPKNVTEQNMDVSLELASRTTGTLLVDDLLFAPFDYADGSWWFLRGGATPWLLDDVYTFADSGGAAADAILQYWFGLAYPGEYLPSTTGTPTWADPA